MTDQIFHKRFGGSNCDRWMNCLGSAALCATVPAAPSSTYAEEGTMAHALAAKCLEEGDRNAFLYRNAPFKWDDHGVAKEIMDVGFDTCAAVNVYLDAVFAELDAAPDAELHIEETFSLGEDVGGTNDALVYSASRKRLAVFDYKHGAGVSVYADNNAQLKFYAVGAALSKPWPIKEIELYVVQPRAQDVDRYGAVRPWKMDPSDLLDFASDIESSVTAAKVIQNDPKLVGDGLLAGEWCKWCPAATVCPAREQSFLKAAQLNFASIVDINAQELPAVAELDTERLAALLEAGDALSAWLGQIRDRVESLLLVEGKTVPGWKVVAKIGRAKWVEDDQKIADHLTMVYDLDEDALRPRKLVTITEAERQIKAVIPNASQRTKALEDLRVRFTIKESSGLTIAPASDRREAVLPGAVDFKVGEAIEELDLNKLPGELKAGPGRCEEASMMSREKYIPCNQPATTLIDTGGQTLRMCDMCADHSVRNRGMKRVGVWTL